uniref:Cell cycle checkpoint protein RAD1 n=1 Tax=Angiostrongylus cantonensis TaxID=6313 RepID=A0A0K0CWV8_ANGCA
MAGGDVRTDQLHALELKHSRVHEFASIIKAISFREAIAYLSNDLFSRFELRERSVHFRLPLNLVIECIAMHTGAGATFKMTYDGDEEPVKLVLEEDGIVVDMTVHTLTTEEELDASSSTVTLSVTNDELLLKTIGEIGTAVTKFPRCSEQFERLQCAEPVTHRYLISFIKNMTAAFAIASKVSLRCDSRGVLSAQFMVEPVEHKQTYIEFYVSSC